MVRLSDLPDYEAAHLLAKNGEPFTPPAWVADTRPPSARKFVLITTAGIHPAGEAPFASNDASYRVLPGAPDVSFAMSHASVNFDRTGFAQDVNLVFPIERFRELAAQGEIGGLADNHYSFMGAGLTAPQYEASVRALAPVLRRDGVDAAFLTPV